MDTGDVHEIHDNLSGLMNTNIGLRTFQFFHLWLGVNKSQNCSYIDDEIKYLLTTHLDENAHVMIL